MKITLGHLISKRCSRNRTDLERIGGIGTVQVLVCNPKKSTKVSARGEAEGEFSL